MFSFHKGSAGEAGLYLSDPGKLASVNPKDDDAQLAKRGTLNYHTISVSLPVYCLSIQEAQIITC